VFRDGKGIRTFRNGVYLELRGGFGFLWRELYSHFAHDLGYVFHVQSSISISCIGVFLLLGWVEIVMVRGDKRTWHLDKIGVFALLGVVPNRYDELFTA